MTENENVGAPEAPAEEQAEKLLPQSKVNELIGKHKVEAFDKGRQAALMELQAQQAQQAPYAQQQQPPMVQQQSQGHLGNMAAQLTPEQLQQATQAMWEAQKQAAEQQKAHETVATFYSRIQAAEEKDPGLHDKLAKVGLVNFHEIVEMATGHDNTAEIMKELVDHPTKMLEIKQLAQLSPYLARAEMDKLSSSIKLNQQALAAEQKVDAPFNQIKTSAYSPDSGELSMKDLKAKFRA